MVLTTKFSSDNQLLTIKKAPKLARNNNLSSCLEIIFF